MVYVVNLMPILCANIKTISYFCSEICLSNMQNDAMT